MGRAFEHRVSGSRQEENIKALAKVNNSVLYREEHLLAHLPGKTVCVRFTIVNIETLACAKPTGQYERILAAYGNIQEERA